MQTKTIQFSEIQINDRVVFATYTPAMETIRYCCTVVSKKPDGRFVMRVNDKARSLPFPPFNGAKYISLRDAGVPIVIRQ
jgi:hypothetical protein